MFEYNGGTYPGVWVYDGSGAQVVGVRLYLTPGVLSDPIPLSQVRVVGSTVGGIVNSNTPPLNPPPGTVWYNSGTTTQNGIPAGNYGYWNGTTWVLMGSSNPQTPVSGQNPPTSPSPGVIWYNSGSNTTSGIPPGHYAYWNGSSWVDLGASQPQLGGTSGVAGVQSLNNLSGAITLAEGSGIDITQAGNTITFTATGVEAGTPGVSSVNGQTGAIAIQGANGTTVNTSTGTVTISAPAPSGAAVSSFNGRSGAVSPLAADYTPAFIGAATASDINAAIAAHNGATDPHPQYLIPVEAYGSDYIAANSAPTGATTGQIWRNTSTNTVSGIPPGNFAVRTPSNTWYDAGPRYPFAINNGTTQVNSLAPGANNTFLQTNGSGQVVWAVVPQTIENPGMIAINSSTWSYPGSVGALQLIADTEVLDQVNGYNPTTGLFTVPSGLGGVWDLGATAQIGDAYAGLVQVYFYLTKNTTTVSGPDTFVNSDWSPNGFRRLILQPGDVMRFYTYSASADRSLLGVPFTLENLTLSAFLVKSI